MTREYDAQSRPTTPKFRENYDRIFRKAKEERRERSAERQRCSACGTALDILGCRKCDPQHP